MSVKRERGTYKRGLNGVEATAVYTVDAEDEPDAEAEVYAHDGTALGAVFTTHQGTIPDIFCVCQDLIVRARTPAPVGGTGLFEVTATFARSSPTDPPAVDVNGPAKWWVERSLVTQPADHDAEGRPIVNSADEPIDPPLTRQSMSKTLVAVWHRSNDSWFAMYNSLAPFEGRLNSAVFAGAPRGCLFCESLQIEEVSGGLFRITGRFAYRPPRELFGHTYEGWSDTVLNLGRRTKGQVVGGKREYPPILMNGVPVADPVPLDANGQRLPDGEDPVVLEFRHHLYADFNDLEIV